VISDSAKQEQSSPKASSEEKESTAPSESEEIGTDKNELLKIALAFLTDFEEGETEVNALLAGYFTQLMGSLLKHNRRGLSEYILTTEGVLESFIG